MPGQRPDSWSIRCARLHTAPPLRGRGKGGQSPLNPTPNPAEIRWSAFSRFSGLSPYPKGGGACAAPQGLSRSIIQPGSSFWRGGRPNKARSWSRSRYASIAAMSRSSGHSLLFTLAKIMAPHQHLAPCFVLALLLLFPCPHPLNFGIDSRSLFFELGQPIRRLVAPLNHLDTPLLMCCLVGYHGGTAAAIPTLLCRGGHGDT